jgi:hypothetical protein
MKILQANLLMRQEAISGFLSKPHTGWFQTRLAIGKSIKEGR